MSDFQSPPNPANSPNEKLVVSRKFPSRREFSQYLLAQGVDPDTAEKIGRAVDEWDRDRDYHRLAEIEEFELWANIHTHPGTGGGGGEPVGPGQAIIAGAGASGSSPEHAFLYDLSNNAFSALNDLPTPISRGYGSSLDGVPYFINGFNPVDSTYPQVTQVWDPTTETWDATRTPRPKGSQHHVAEFVNGLLYVIGGTTDGSWTGDVDIYDPVADTWSAGTPLSTGRLQDAGNQSCVIDGEIYIIGGYNGTDSNSCRKYIPSTDTWVSLAAFPNTSLQSGGAIRNADGTKIYAFMGFLSGSSDGSAQVAEYDVAANAWALMADAFDGQKDFGLVKLSDGKARIFGGQSETTAHYTYDPSTDTWVDEAPPAFPEAKSHMAAIAI